MLEVDVHADIQALLGILRDVVVLHAHGHVGVEQPLAVWGAPHQNKLGGALGGLEPFQHAHVVGGGPAAGEHWERHRQHDLTQPRGAEEIDLTLIEQCERLIFALDFYGQLGGSGPLHTAQVTGITHACTPSAAVTSASVKPSVS